MRRRRPLFLLPLLLAALAGCPFGGSGGEARPIRRGETVLRTASMVGSWSILDVSGEKILAPATRGTVRLTGQGQFVIEGERSAMNAQGQVERRPTVTSGTWYLKRGVLVLKPLDGTWKLEATCTGDGPERVLLVDVLNFKMVMVRVRQISPAVPGDR